MNPVASLKAFVRRSPLYTWWLRRRTDALQREFWALTDFEWRQVAFYAQFVREGDLVFDVGAHRGNRSKVFACLGARVVAFEPQADCAAYLGLMMRAVPGFALERVALGASEGVGALAKAGAMSSLSADFRQTMVAQARVERTRWQGRPERVRLTTMDAAIGRHGVPTFVKIDVEGFEVQVLRGLSRPVPALSLEVTGDQVEEAAACIDRLERLGRYRYRFSRGESLAFAWEAWVSAPEARLRLQDPRGSLWGDLYALTRAAPILSTNGKSF
jgi:FkbM family methyltransferase